MPLPAQRFVYRPMMYWVLFRAVMQAVLLYAVAAFGAPVFVGLWVVGNCSVS
jgi:hypothetical protein